MYNTYRIYFTYTKEGFALSSSKRISTKVSQSTTKSAHTQSISCVYRSNNYKKFVCVCVHNQQQKEVWCVCNQQQQVVHAQLTTSIACAQSTTTSECTPINSNNKMWVCTRCKCTINNIKCIQLCVAQLLWVVIFFTIYEFFCKNKISFLYTKVASKVNIIRR